MKIEDTEEGFPASAIREIGILKELTHINIIKLWNVIIYDKKIVLVFEYCDEDLYEFQKKKMVGLQPLEIKQFMFQLLKGVDYLHKNNFMHRDLKPQNLLLIKTNPSLFSPKGIKINPENNHFPQNIIEEKPTDELQFNNSLILQPNMFDNDGSLKINNKVFSSFELDSQPQKKKRNLIKERLNKKRKKEEEMKQPKKILKIADFGLSRSCSVPVQTLTNEVVTLWYRSPELLLGSLKYNQKCDIWSVGCIFSEMVTGYPLFKGINPEEQLDKIFQKRGSPEVNGWDSVLCLPNYIPGKWSLYSTRNQNDVQNLMDAQGN